ncbi:hypothetical protein GH714_014730 [Hevea brasiliensis]|uniref:NB-ARC domain-containing protein n=1 Tax=Hevea brasiliensis TaxID=3981 RepID=A0A6A6L6H4_HEVBR|nr:hypothetical protein GH714_014730 [Hevea brasiliensis]
MIVSALQKEATLLVGVRDELDEIRKELQIVKSFLQDAERKPVMSDVEKAWVADVRDIAHQIEDLIDEFMDSAPYMEEDDLVGFEEESRLLKIWLMDIKVDRAVISVVAMGGSGKTTLVAKTYKDETVKSHFECYAWINVSQTYTRDDLLRSLIKEFHKTRKEQVPDDLCTKGFNDLVEFLIGYLKEKKYLVVLDDVWDINL